MPGNQPSTQPNKPKRSIHRTALMPAARWIHIARIDDRLLRRQAVFVQVRPSLEHPFCAAAHPVVDDAAERVADRRDGDGRPEQVGPQLGHA